MVSIMEIMQLCRLCLVKEQVNVPIFDDQDDIGQICLKITACLPVKVSKEDKLPKKICDGCLYKLELLYQFYNTTVNAEKQLISWIEETNMDINSKNAGDLAAQSQTTVKQEKLEPAESTNENSDLTADSNNYILEEQQLQYQADFQYKESKNTNAEDIVNAEENSDEPIAKRPRRRRQATKPIPPESLDSSDNDADDPMLEMTVTKTEEESESDGDDNVDDPEPVKYDAGGEDTEQPGPSGLGKGGTDPPDKMEAYTLQENLGRFVKCEIFTDTLPIPFQCGKCIQLFSTRQHLQEHLDVEHDDQQIVGSHHCEICKKSFKRRFYLNLHRKVIHEKKSDFSCEYCCRLFLSNHALKQHLVSHTKQYKYKCDQCEKGYSTSKELDHHVNVLHKGIALTCENCNKKFVNKRYYEIHMLKHQSDYIKKVYKCQICSLELAWRESLRVHMKTHSSSHAGRYICEICGKGVTSTDSLKKHQRIHTGEKPHPCEVCPKRFLSKVLLRTHMLTHTKEKPHSCHICPKRFSQRSSLTVHLRYHTGERPYECDICKKKYVTRTLLNTHMKVHGIFLK